MDVRKPFKLLSKQVILVLILLAALVLVAGACGGDEATSTPTATTAPVATATPTAPALEPTPTTVPQESELSYQGATGSRGIDGAVEDWVGVPVLSVPMATLDGKKEMNVDLQVSFDTANIYMLVSVPDDFNATPGEHKASGAYAALWAIDEGAGPHMGTDGVDWATSLGMVDVWHWEIDCGPGVVSGGQNRTEDGNDPTCNLDDEYATTVFDRDDDDGDNFLRGVYDHSARASGEDSEGTWYWEISRPLTTNDPQDAQFAPGGTAKLALAYWDPDETPNGWTDSGHYQSASTVEWITVNVPSDLP